MRNQHPSIAKVGGLWSSLTLVGFDKVNFTAVTDEYMNRQDIKYLDFRKINQSKIKVYVAVSLPKHNPSIGFSTAVVGNIVTGPLMPPSRLNLNFNKSATDIKNKIVW